MTLSDHIRRRGLTILLALNFAIIFVIQLNHEKWIHRTVIIQDVSNYYSYLPALFHEKDLSLSFLTDSVHRDHEANYTPNHTKDGRMVIKTSMGMAISYLPFFLVADLFAGNENGTKDGFSGPYQFAVQFSTLIYNLIALVILWRFLRLYFSANAVFYTLLCLTFTTNIFYYLTFGPGMSHIVGLFLVSAFLYGTENWYKKPGYRNGAILGVVFGFIVLVRPINAVVLLYFLLYKISNFEGLGLRLRNLLRDWRKVILMGIFSFIVFVPQLLYWKYATGHYVFFSYVGERFFLGHPHLVDGLFSFRKGWFVYTPVMLFAACGFFLLRDKARSLLVPITVSFIVFLYFTFSWWCWWYGGSFGARTLIDFYPLVLIPLGAFFEYARSFTLRSRTVFICVIVVLTLLNIFQSMQAKWNIIHYDSMTAKSYWNVFGRLPDEEERKKYLEKPDYEGAIKTGGK